MMNKANFIVKELCIAGVDGLYLNLPCPAVLQYPTAIFLERLGLHELATYFEKLHFSIKVERRSGPVATLGIRRLSGNFLTK